MENFTVYNPVKLHFGKNSLDFMADELKNLGKKALILYGKNSAKKYGYFDKVVEKLNIAGIDFCEFSGIKANPVVDDVKKAADFAKKENIDFIIALGGGSVIDTAKIVALTHASGFDPWDIMKYKVNPDNATPIAVVLTFAGTGSEMNPFAVVQNHETHEKIGFYHEKIFPVYSYLNPEFTLSIPKEQTIYGIADLIAHSLEAFFAEGFAPLSDKFTAALINEAMETGLALVNDLNNYELRARIMWAATTALNGTLYHGRLSTGDWGVHALGHVFSYLYDTPHGATLSLVYPAWLKFMKNRIPERIEQLGELLLGYEVSADDTIDYIENFFVNIGAPVRLSEINVCYDDLPKVIEYAEHMQASGMNHQLTKKDYEEIFKLL